MLLASIASMWFTLIFVLPLSVLRVFLPQRKLAMRNPQFTKKVLIIGASRGIGHAILKKYAQEPDTIIVAASKNIDKLRNSVIELRDAPAKILCQSIDLTADYNEIGKIIKEIDSEAPITHLYEVSGMFNISDHETPWTHPITQEIINVNIHGTVSAVLTTYECMKKRLSGKICIVGSIAGVTNPANMILYSSTKSFLNNFTTSLRVLAAPCGIDVISVQPGFIDTRMTVALRSQDSVVPDWTFAFPEGLADSIVHAVEKGGFGIVTWPFSQGLATYALKAVNPISEEFGKWLSMGFSGNKIS